MQKTQEKNKYIDNRLAEELDVIVLTTNAYQESGLPRGSLGVLVYSYTGRGRPLYGRFRAQSGEKREVALRLRDFRVLNENRKRDLLLLSEYNKKRVV
ncbi:MAG: hypothetical protein IJ506_08665 [Clostridia bacterium]|nr:hypothetical protein [Clostridia bacterium]